MHLGDEDFRKFFTDSNDGPETRLVSPVEIVHYLDIFINNHLCDYNAYREKAEAHIYSLLSRFALFPSKSDTKMCL
jgi:hypothetical protein